MQLRTVLICLALAGASVGAPTQATAQEHPARRLSSIVGVAVEEYAKGIDEQGKMLSTQEYQEAVEFLGDARAVADRLSGERAEGARLLLDSLAQAVARKAPPSAVAALHERFVQTLGADGALELPRRPLNPENGREIYQRECASCHGAAGAGDGPASTGMSPPPIAIGDAEVMRDATPALLYRVVSVGIKGTAMTSFGDGLSAEDRWDVITYIHSLRATEAERLEGEGLFMQRCASCHGALGASDGAVASSLTRLPPDVGSFLWQVEKSDAEIADAIRNGVPGSAMVAWPDASDQDLARIVAFIRTLPAKRAESPVVASSDSLEPAQIAQQVRALLSQALAASQAGRTDDASDRAFDAYLEFEPLETSVRPKSPGLIASLESRFAEFRAAVKSGDSRAAVRSRDAIETGLPEVVALTDSPAGAWGAFLQSFLIILREGFEAILVIGAIVAFLIKTSNRERLTSIWIGCGIGVAASAVTAVILKTVLSALPATRELIEGITLLVAVAVLFSVSYWLISKVEAAKWQRFIKEKVESALSHGGGGALAFVAFLAVYREGAETALFYQALFSGGHDVALPIALGIVAGGAALAVIFTLFYRFGVRIPLRPFFAVTSVLLYYMAFVFAGKGIRELQEANAVSITLIHGFPELPAMGMYPTVETLLAQLVLLALFAAALLKTFWPRRAVTLPVTSPPVPALTERMEALQLRVEALERQARSLTSSDEPVKAPHGPSARTTTR